jgi:hypothetical protein
VDWVTVHEDFFCFLWLAGAVHRVEKNDAMLFRKGDKVQK